MKLGCCGSFFPYLSADGVVKAVFVALVLVTPFDALKCERIRWGAERRFSKNKLLLVYAIAGEGGVCWRGSSTLANVMSLQIFYLIFLRNPKFN